MIRPAGNRSCSEGFAPQLDWIIANLEQPHTVATLARRANMSARTFARRFVDETGTTPMQWITDQRVLYARRLLEETDLEIDRVAERSGFVREGGRWFYTCALDGD